MLPGLADSGGPSEIVGSLRGRRCQVTAAIRSVDTFPKVTAMLDEIRERIEGEIEQLQHELNVVLPDCISKAVELGDLKENSEYHSALERQRFVQARIEHLSQRMSELSKIDVDAMPADRVGFGSQVTIIDVELDEEMTFTLVAGDFMDLEAGHVSLASPIGSSLMGSREGEDVTVALPTGERRYRVKGLVTLPEQLGLAR